MYAEFLVLAFTLVYVVLVALYAEDHGGVHHRAGEDVADLLLRLVRVLGEQLCVVPLLGHDHGDHGLVPLHLDPLLHVCKLISNSHHSRHRRRKLTSEA